MIHITNEKTVSISNPIIMVNNRAAYSPAEVAKLFGMERTWAYRRIYDGTFSTLAIAGKRFISASSIVKLLQTQQSAVPTQVRT